MASQYKPDKYSIPESLSHLIAINVDFEVIICLGHGCQCAVSPAAISNHMRRKHKTQLELRKQVDRYINQCLFEYNYSTVKLPVDGLAPQPIVKVVDGLQCQHCNYKTQSRDKGRKHGNTEHGKKRQADEDLFTSVRLQSWFWGGKERYWVVDERQQADAGRDHGSRSCDETSNT